MHSTQARPVERVEHLARRREAGDLARRVGDPEVLLAASSQQMAGALLWADRSEYDSGLAAYVEVAHATGRAVPLVLSDVNRACGVALDGRCEEALALFEDAMRPLQALR